MVNRVKVLGASVLLALVAGGCASAATAGQRQWTDAHLHYVDFMQESEGPQAMMAAMDLSLIHI